LTHCPMARARGRTVTVSKTIENLKEAFAGESQANRKYLAYAKKADEEGHAQAARMFRAAAAAETVHAHAHLRAMGGIGTTRDNLEDAISGETHEFTKMYPGMIETADAEGNAQAATSFRYANEVEKIHAELYRGILDGLDGGEEQYSYFVCPVCGNTVAKAAPEKCPICATAGSRFAKIE
jgi:rubrerythrin